MLLFKKQLLLFPKPKLVAHKKVQLKEKSTSSSSDDDDDDNDDEYIKKYPKVCNFICHSISSPRIASHSCIAVKISGTQSCPHVHFKALQPTKMFPLSFCRKSSWFCAQCSYFGLFGIIVAVHPPTTTNNSTLGEKGTNLHPCLATHCKYVNEREWGTGKAFLIGLEA